MPSLPHFWGREGIYYCKKEGGIWHEIRYFKAVCAHNSGRMEADMKQLIIRIIIGLTIVGICTTFFGCGGIHIGELHNGAGEKVRDLEFTILSDERIPAELKTLLEERKEEAFELTYHDKEFLYICIGYGRQEYSGHSIVVNALFLGEQGILVDTSLIGPEAGSEKINTAQFPVIVLKTELIEDVPLFTK